MKRLVLAALIASLAGDALLLSPALFLPGLVAFLIAHGFYIAAFSRGVGFLPSRIAARRDRRLRRARARLCLARRRGGARSAGRDLCRGRCHRRRPGDWPRDGSARQGGDRGRGRRDPVHAVRHDDRARQIRPCRLAGRPVDAADLLSRARADRLLCPAARAAIGGDSMTSDPRPRLRRDRGGRRPRGGDRARLRARRPRRLRHAPPAPRRARWRSSPQASAPTAAKRMLSGSTRARRPMSRLSSTTSSGRSGRSRFSSSTSAPTCAFPSSRRRRRSIPKSGRWRPSRASSPDGRRRA